MIKRKKTADPIASQPAPAVPAEDPVTLLKGKINEAQQAAEAARVTFNAAVLEFELTSDIDASTAAAKRKNVAAVALEEARSRVLELQGALEAAEVRKANEAEAQAQREKARRWAETRKHLEARAKAAADYDKAVTEMVDAYQRIISESESARVACPHPRGERVGGLMIGTDVQNSLRLTLVRAGLRWAHQWPWPADKLPSQSEAVAKANAEVLSLAEANAP